MNFIHTKASVAVILDGNPFVVAHDQPQYERLIEAIKASDEAAVREILTASEKLTKGLAAFGDVTVYGGHVTYGGEELHNYVSSRILEFVEQGIPFAPLGRFLENVLQNPSRRAVEGLYAWCERAQMPITEDGCILAYKIVNHDFTDCYTGKFDNTPGKVAEVPRNQVDDNPDNTCSHGLHFCSASYLPRYGPAGKKKVILVKVNPADVVAFPRDYNLAKARCCRHESLQEVDGAQFFPSPVYAWRDPEDAGTTEYEDNGAVLRPRGTLAERLELVISEIGVSNDGTLIEKLQRAEHELGL